MANKTKAFNQSNNPLYILGIGASAGGLEALITLIENTPDSTRFSFVILRHLSPDHKSMMGDLLSRHTIMNVIEAKDGMPLNPNWVYLLPSKNL